MNHSTDVIVVSDGDNRVVFDTRYFPLLVASWQGELTVNLIDQYFDTRQRIFFDRERVLGVVVATDLSLLKAPSAAIRKYLAESGKVRDADGFVAGYTIAVPNAIMRGMVTALTWIAGSKDVRGYFPTIGEAMAKASSILADLGVDHLKVDFKTYQVPTK